MPLSQPKLILVCPGVSLRGVSAADPAFPPDQRRRVLERVMTAITRPKHLNTRRQRSYPQGSGVFRECPISV
jgi:hypothetical protein